MEHPSNDGWKTVKAAMPTYCKGCSSFSIQQPHDEPNCEAQGEQFFECAQDMACGGEKGPVTPESRALKALLRDHLSVDVSLHGSSDDYGSGIQVKVSVEFDDEVITESDCFMYADLHSHQDEE